MRFYPEAIAVKRTLVSILAGILLLFRGGTEAADPPPRLTVGNIEYLLVGKCDHEQYDLALTVKRPPAVPLNIVFGLKDAKNHYRLTMDAKTCALARVVDGAEKVLQNAPAPAPAFHDGKPADQAILVKRRAISLSVVMDSRPVLHVLDSAFAVGGIGMDVKSGTLAAHKYQPCAPIEFSADFMRDENETGLDPWIKVGGEWQFHSVKEKHSGARSKYSSNAFSFGGKTGKDHAPALVVTGHPFWDDYDASVSVKSQGSPAGLVFGYRGKADYFLLRWHLGDLRRIPRKVELVRVSPQGTKTLAEGYAVGATDQWYRLQAVTRGDRIQVFLDDAPMFDVACGEFVSGQIGLCVEGEAEAQFDDVLVRSNDRYDLSRADVVKWIGQPTGPAWTTKADERGNVTLAPGAAGEATYGLGDSAWKNHIFEANVKPSPGAQGIGVSVGPGLLFRWGGKAGPYAGKKQLLLLDQDGKPAVFAEGPGAFAEGCEYALMVDVSDGKHAKVYIDGLLELMAGLPSAVAGAPALRGLNAQGTEFRSCRLAFSQTADWEREPENEIFRQDRFMVNWATRHGAWVPTGNNIFWHKGDFFGTFSAAVPLKPGHTLALCADAEDFKRGYAVDIAAAPQPSKDYVITINRLDKAAMQATVKGPPAEEIIGVHRDGKYVWVSVGNNDVMVYRDDAPLPGTRLGLRAPETPDFAKLPVKRDHVGDCLFEDAPVEWLRVGTWEVTNRFTCTPWWGHMTGWSRGAAALWHKAKFSGDMTIEYYVGLRMRQASEMLEDVGVSYARMGDMNITFCGDGRNLDSGYSFVLSAWDRTWSEQWTELRRCGKVVQKSDKFLCPRTREDQSRRIAVPWMPEYNQRAIHGAWYYVKVRKIGKRIECYFDNELVFNYEDPEPLAGKRVALWTQDNSIVVARVSLSYAAKTMPPVSVPAPKPVPEPAALENTVVTSSTHPGVLCDFEGDMCGWKSTGLDQGAHLSLDGTTCSEGKQSLKLTNLNAGGDFGVTIPTPTIPLPYVRTFSFDYKLQPDVKVNLYLTLCKRRHFIQFTGDDYSDENLICLGKIADVKADGAWHTAHFDIAAAVRERYPCQSGLTLDGLEMGNFHEGYLRAGFGGNPDGAIYHIDNFRIVTIGRNPVNLMWRPGNMQYSLCLDQKPNTQPPDAVSGGKNAQQYAKLGDGLWYFHVKGKGRDGKWTPTAHYPFFVQEQPLAVAKIEPASGAAWGGGPFQVHFAWETGLQPDIAKMGLKANGTGAPLNDHTLLYDPRKRILTLDLAESGLHFANGQKVDFALQYCEDLAAPIKTSTYTWSYTMAWAQDKAPPSPVRLVGYLANDTFEDGVGSWESFGSHGDAFVTRDPTTAASGKYSLKLFNPVVGGYFRAQAHGSAVNLGKYPLLAFDYKLTPTVATDLLIRPATSGQYGCIQFAGGSSGIEQWGTIPNVSRDGAWHHAEINVHELLAKQPYDPNMYEASQIAFGTHGNTRNGPTETFHIDNFQIIPVVSAKTGFRLTWGAVDPSGIKGYSYHWSPKDVEDADATLEGPEAEKTFTGIPEGPMYLHIRAQDNAGNWGPTSHYKFVIDNTPPTFTAPPSGKNSSARMAMSATDAGPAGVDPASMQVAVEGKGYGLHAVHTSLDPGKGTIAWEWCAATGWSDTPAPDGKAIQFAMPQVKDFAGNTAGPFAWTWTIDYASDKEPPLGPDVKGLTHPIASFDAFSRGMGEWRSWGGQSGALVERFFDPEKKDHCVRLTNATASAAFCAYIRTSPFDAAACPMVSFEYRIPKGAKIHMLAHINGNYHAIQMTSQSRSYTNIGQIAVTDDGVWHTTSFNLYEILKKNFPKLDKYSVQYLCLSDYNSGANQAEVSCCFDNFSIFGPGEAQPAFEWHSLDPTGIKAFAYSMDTNAVAEPPTSTATADRKKTLPQLPHKGLYYLHVRAQDCAGNWGPTTHYPYSLATDPPKPKPPEPAKPPAPAPNPPQQAPPAAPADAKKK
ncbi:MAG: hypothetical protein AB1696_08510 [Planctomycetota bacterium]